MSDQLTPAQLEKGLSAAVHIGKMKKAVSEFHDHMKAFHAGHLKKVLAGEATHAMHKAHFEATDNLHKAHKEDMHTAFGMLHKILGTEEATADGGGDDTPKAENIESKGTESLIHFKVAEGGTVDIGKMEKALQIAKDSKCSAETITKLETDLVLAKAVLPDPKPLTDAPVTVGAFAELMKKNNEEMQKSTADLVTAIFKGVLGKAADEEDGKTCKSCNKPMADCKCKVDKAAETTDVSKGVGDRTQVAHPVQKLAQPEGINKGAQPAAEVDTSRETVEKALGGDAQAALAMF